MNKKQNKRIRQEALRFAEYMAAGGAQFWSGYGAYFIFDALLGIAFWPAKVGSYFIGATVNFILERYWVFRGKKTSKKDVQDSAQKFYGIMFINFIVDLVIVGGLREAGISPYVGQFASAGFFTVFNYLIFKFWVFRGKKPNKRPR